MKSRCTVHFSCRREEILHCSTAHPRTWLMAILASRWQKTAAAQFNPHITWRGASRTSPTRPCVGADVVSGRLEACFSRTLSGRGRIKMESGRGVLHAFRLGCQCVLDVTVLFSSVNGDCEVLTRLVNFSLQKTRSVFCGKSRRHEF